jgi:hypothetical protein
MATPAAPAGDTKAACEDSAPGDSFAALLAAFSTAAGGAPAAAADPAPDGAALPADGPATAGDGPQTEAKDAAALIAASFAGLFMAQLPAPVVSTPTTGGAPVGQAVSPAKASETLSIGDVVPAAAGDALKVAAGAPAVPALVLGEIAPTAPELPAAAPEIAAPMQAPVPLAVMATVAAAVEPKAAGLPLAPEAPPLPGAGDAGPHDESPGAVALGVEISVVRTVGNAQQSQADLPGGSHHDDGDAKPASEPQGGVSASAAAMPAPGSAPAPDAVATAAPIPSADTTPPPAVQQVARAVIEKLEQGGGEVRIRLDPPELGRVSIHVRIEGDRVQVTVQAERADAMNLLRQHSLDLSTLLGSRGLNLTDVNVGLGGRQTPGGPGAETSNDTDSEDGQFAEMLGIDATPAVERHNRLQATYNPDGRHLYRV